MWPLKFKLPNKWSAWTFQLFIFLIPIQTSIFIYSGEWGRGFVNPYISFFFSVSEALLLIAGILFAVEHKHQRWRKGGIYFLLLLLCILASAGLSLVLSNTDDGYLKLLSLISLFEYLLIFLLVTNKALKVNQIFKTLTWAMSLQAILGILQVMFGHSLGFQFFGEPTLSENTSHIARLSIFGWDLIRAYGTFSHPNILGGFLAISLLGTLLYPPESKKERNGHLILQFIGILFTFSRSALLGLIIGIIVLSFRSVSLLKTTHSRWTTRGIFLLVGIEILFIILSRPIPLTEDPAIQSRIQGYQMAKDLILNHPFGVGWGLETLYLDEVSEVNLKPWDYQPTHNLFLLIWAETGWIGIASFVSLLIYSAYKLSQHEKILGTKHESGKKNFFLAMGFVILCTGLVDHYWVSLEQGRFLAILILASIARFLSDPIPIYPITKAKHSSKSLLAPAKKLQH